MSDGMPDVTQAQSRMSVSSRWLYSGPRNLDRERGLKT